MKLDCVFIIFPILMLFSCTPNNTKYQRVRIANYSIGDKIDTTNFTSENKSDSIIVVYKSKQNSGLDIFAWQDTIVWIGYHFNSKKEFFYTLDTIKSTIKAKPEYLENGSRSGINYKGNEYFWNDTLTGDEISMLFYEDSLGRFKGAGFIENTEFIEKIVPSGPQFEIKFIVK